MRVFGFAAAAAGALSAIVAVGTAAQPEAPRQAGRARTRQRRPKARRFAGLFTSVMALSCVPAFGQVADTPTSRTDDVQRRTDDVGTRGEPADRTSPRIVSVTPGGWIAGPAGLSDVVVRFSEDVFVGDAAVRVIDGAGGDVPFGTDYNPATAELRLTLDETFRQDRLRVILDYAITDAAGNELDGEVASPLAPLLPSGDGVRGGQTVLQWNVLAGDATRDGVVDDDDRQAVFDALGLRIGDRASTRPRTVNGDGAVNVLDKATLLNNAGASIPATDGGAPTVTATDPAEGASFSGDLSEITVTFDEPVDASSVTPRRLYVVSSLDELTAASTATVSPDGQEAVFGFEPALEQCDVYALSLSNAVRDVSQALAETSGARMLVDGLAAPPSPTIEVDSTMTSGSTVVIEGDAPGATSSCRGA